MKYRRTVEKQPVKMTKIQLKWAEGLNEFCEPREFTTHDEWFNFLSRFKTAHTRPGSNVGYDKMSLILHWADGNIMGHRLDYKSVLDAPVDQLYPDLVSMRDFHKEERFKKCDKHTQDHYHELSKLLSERALNL